MCYIFIFSGHYIYIEASSPRRPNDKAQLISQTFKGSSRPTCFQFWYSMVGTTIGSLNIYMQTVTTQNSVNKLMWSLSGNQQQPWIQGRFSINSRTSYQVYLYLHSHRGIHGKVFRFIDFK